MMEFIFSIILVISFIGIIGEKENERLRTGCIIAFILSAVYLGIANLF